MKYVVKIKNGKVKTSYISKEFDVKDFIDNDCIFDLIDDANSVKDAYSREHPMVKVWIKLVRFWVIHTLEKETRFIEVVYDGEYGLVYNIHYAKVWASVNPPIQALTRFEKRTKIKADLKEVPVKAYNHYLYYMDYVYGRRELDENEKKELEEWKLEHKPILAKGQNLFFYDNTDV